MILIERIETLPELDWSEQAAKELETSKAYLRETEGVELQLVVGAFVFGVVGISYATLLGRPWVWFLGSRSLENITRFELKQLQEAAELLPRMAYTAVEKSFVAGLRFAEFLGFVPSGNEIIVGDITYLEYERL